MRDRWGGNAGVHRPAGAGSTGMTDREGLFGAGSAFWLVLRESAVLLGGGRALLLQLAHPLVAAGVAEHSGFRANPLRRLEHTLDVMLTIAFGDRCEGRRALRALTGVHVRVRGVLPAAAGPFPAGTRYTAGDPHLRLWVHATLMDSALVVYQRFVRRLSHLEQQRFYEDSKQLARLMDIPENVIPPTLADFQHYMAGMVAGDTLAVTVKARELAYQVLYPPIPLMPRMASRVVAFITPGLLPPRLRRAYGLRWGPMHQAILDIFSQITRLTLPLLPPALRLMPHARAAARRLAGRPAVRLGFPRWLGVPIETQPLEPETCRIQRHAAGAQATGRRSEAER